MSHMKKDIDRSDKKSKWTVMKYVNDFNLLLKYAAIVRDLKAKVDDNSIVEINSIMKSLGVYQPKGGKMSVDTTNFKICQIVYFMFAYRSKTKNKEIVYSPLGNLLLDNMDKKDWVAKIFATMLYELPFNHPFNKMNPSFNIFPFRLVFKLLTDDRLESKLYEDEMFYLVFWVKEINIRSYERLVADILRFRSLSSEDKYSAFTNRLSVQDTLANALHETTYLFGQLDSAGIATLNKGRKVGILRQGGFGRGEVPDYIPPEEMAKHKPTGRRAYTTEYIELSPTVTSLIKKLLDVYPFYEKPHDLSDRMVREDYILQLYNFYPSELLENLGLKQNKLQLVLDITNGIKKYSRNQNDGDCYRFEDVLVDAFNEFDDVDARKIGGSGETDIECVYLIPRPEKFAVEAKSTKTKLSGISTGRLRLHRIKIGANYTIIVAPYYKPSVITDIEDSDNVLISASSLSNFLYQCAVHNPECITYKPLHEIIKDNMGRNITDNINEYVARTFGIGKSE